MTREKADAIVRDLTRDGYAAHTACFQPSKGTVPESYQVVVTGCRWPVTQSEKLSESIDFDEVRRVVGDLPCS